MLLPVRALCIRARRQLNKRLIRNPLLQCWKNFAWASDQEHFRLQVLQDPRNSEMFAWRVNRGMLDRNLEWLLCFLVFFFFHEFTINITCFVVKTQIENIAVFFFVVNGIWL